jgi:hypothetical protein
MEPADNSERNDDLVKELFYLFTFNGDTEIPVGLTSEEHEFAVRLKADIANLKAKGIAPDLPID